jgi:hypothetical protein
MSVLIHEQSGRRTIYYPDDRHLRQYADAGPTLISIQVWSDPASAEKAFRDGLVIWENDEDPPEARSSVRVSTEAKEMPCDLAALAIQT